MKIIIAGSRTLTNINIIDIINNSLLNLTNSEGLSRKQIQIISGGATGVDTLAIHFALDNDIPYKKFPANWHEYGKKAGYLRNIEMANYADALIAIWDGKSKGTKHMIDIAEKKGLKIYIYKVENDNS